MGVSESRPIVFPMRADTSSTSLRAVKKSL